VTADATTPQPSRVRRLRHSRRAVLWAVGVAAVAVMLLSTEYRPVGAPAAGTTDQFDAAGYAAKAYDSKVVPSIRKNAVELPVLLEKLRQDQQAASEKYGNQVGSGSYTFAVRGEGVAGSPDSGLLPVRVEGVPSDTTVSVQIGPAINGTALRDAVSSITFDQFLNQVQYADAGTALNDEMKKRVLADLDRDSLEGKRVRFVGAFSMLTPETVTITPTRLEVQQ
jgi:predicted lipoprotein